jgi:hypothetical protein
LSAIRDVGSLVVLLHPGVEVLDIKAVGVSGIKHEMEAQLNDEQGMFEKVYNNIPLKNKCHYEKQEKVARKADVMGGV